MSWWGKLIGGTFGFMLGGPLGALLGAVIGHNFDKGINDLPAGHAGKQERVQTAFFTAVFSVMGHISKADGQVSKSEIAMAEQVMRSMQLAPEQRRAAIELFNQGKQSGFPLRDIIVQFNRELGLRLNLKRMFLEIEIAAALADGVIHADEERELLKICDWLHFPRSDFDRLVAMVKAEFHSGNTAARQKGMSLDDAYAILNIKSSATTAEIKKAYRRMLSQHHPDKLVSKGLPEEMMKTASQKTHEIKQAYERIKLHRGF